MVDTPDPFDAKRGQVCFSYSHLFLGHNLVIQQLVESLNNVAEAMRICARVAEGFAQVIQHSPLSANALQALHFPQTLSDAPEKSTTTTATTATKRKAKALEPEGEGTKKKRVRKPRDPNEPKRPASSYIMFQNDVRKELKSQNPNVSQSDLLQMIAKQWSEMTEDQKSVRLFFAHRFQFCLLSSPRPQVYSQANATAKERYSAEKAAYIATKNTGAEIPPPTPAPVSDFPMMITVLDIHAPSRLYSLSRRWSRSANPS